MKKIKILSIDGGGIRGIIPGVILTNLEKRLQDLTKTDKKLGDFFDFIAGTSTGGILACIYLARGADNRPRFAANDAVQLYLDKGQQIFATTRFEKLLKLYQFFEPKYGSENIESCLEEYFKNDQLSSLLKPCLITSYEISSRKAMLFTSADASEPMWDFFVKDVCRATSAAPTYFPPAHIHSLSGEEYALVDGGVYANNPALCAYAEARKTQFKSLFQDSELTDCPTAKNMLIVSLGTGTVTKPYHYKNYKNAGEIKWLKPIIDILMSANSETVHYQLTKMYQTLAADDSKDYYRMEPSLAEACSEMDDVSAENLEHLKQAGLHYVSAQEDLLDEIAKKIILHS